MAAWPAVPPGFVPESFTVSATRWWVPGRVPCGSRDCPAIVATTDGGAAFQSRPAPGQVTGLEPGLGEVLAVVAPPFPPCALAHN